MIVLVWVSIPYRGKYCYYGIAGSLMKRRNRLNYMFLTRANIRWFWWFNSFRIFLKKKSVQTFISTRKPYDGGQLILPLVRKSDAPSLIQFIDFIWHCSLCTRSFPKSVPPRHSYTPLPHRLLWVFYLLCIHTPEDVLFLLWSLKF